MLHHCYFTNPTKQRCFSHVIQWEVVKASDLPKVLLSVVSPGFEVWAPNYSSTAVKSLLFELPVQAASPSSDLHTSSLAPQGAVCLPVNCFDFLPQGRSWPGLHLLQAEAELGPGSSRAFVLRACSSCWEQVARKAKGDDHQGSSLEGGRGRQADRVHMRKNSKCPP